MGIQYLILILWIFSRMSSLYRLMNGASIRSINLWTQRLPQQFFAVSVQQTMPVEGPKRKDPRDVPSWSAAFKLTVTNRRGTNIFLSIQYFSFCIFIFLTFWKNPKWPFWIFRTNKGFIWSRGHFHNSLCIYIRLKPSWSMHIFSWEVNNSFNPFEYIGSHWYKKASKKLLELFITCIYS